MLKADFKRLYIAAVKNLLAFFISLLTVQLTAQEYSFMHDGYDRPYLVHLPTGYDPANEYPLVLAFHGGLGKGSQLENQSLLSIKADAEGFIVVYPDGVSFGALNIRTWNAGHCCGEAMNNNVDDVGFVEELVDTLKKNYSIADDKVYGTGMSNGGFLCYRIACENPDLFAAIAPVACSMALDDCPSTKMVPIAHFQSLLDDNIPYTGGVGDGLSTHHNPPLDSVADVWAVKGNCSLNDFWVSPTYEMRIDEECDCGNKLRFYYTSDGGHSWPGGTKTLGDDVSTQINANDLMWDFFSEYPKSCSVGSDEINFKEKIWPNPTSDILNVPFRGGKQIIDLTGRTVAVTNAQTFNLIDLPSGFYFLNVGEEVFRIVKK